MLKGISPVVTGDLLLILDRMGHGDDIVFTDAHFPSFSTNARVLNLPGCDLPEILDGVLPLLAIDTYVADPLAMVQPVDGDAFGEGVLEDVRHVLSRHAPDAPPLVLIERFAFYERARRAFAVVATGETRKYGNLLIKKGVTPVTPGHRRR